MFDWEALDPCEYVVGNYEGEKVICGEPATYQGWWDDDEDTAIVLCEKHLRQIREEEDRKKYNELPASDLAALAVIQMNDQYR